MSAHLENAARTLALILHRIDPEHSFTVSIREGDRHDPRALPASALWQDDGRPESQDAAAILDGRTPASTGRADHDRGKQAA